MQRMVKNPRKEYFHHIRPDGTKDKSSEKLSFQKFAQKKS
jgi:hypothetical protein